MKNDNIKNDNLKSEWSTFSIYRKICFVIFVVLITSLILGSVGGLLYLFKPKKANAEEIIGGTTEGSIISTAIVSVPVSFWCQGAYTTYPSTYDDYITLTFSYPFLFKTERGALTLQVYNVTDFAYKSYSLPKLTGYGIILSSYLSSHETDFQFYLSCSHVNLLNNSFDSLYSVVVTYTEGTNESVDFLLTDINGSTLGYSLQPYRYDNWGEYYLNLDTAFSGYWVYIANSNINFTERLNQAKEESFNNGYNQGYTEGKDYGYNVGYNQGVNDTDKFTFSSLLNAIFYAPLKAFISIFNFEVLGVNVLNIISFLFTMLIAIGIIRWVV